MHWLIEPFAFLDTFVQMVVVARYSLLLPTAIVALAVVGYCRGNRLLDGVFLVDKEHPVRFVTLTMMSILAVGLSFIAIRVTWLNVHERLCDCPRFLGDRFGLLWGILWIIEWLALGLLVPLVTVRASVLGDKNVFALTDPLFVAGALRVLLGTVVGTFVFVLLSATARFLIHPGDAAGVNAFASTTPFDEWISIVQGPGPLQAGIEGLTSRFDPFPGYTKALGDGRVVPLPGHFQLGVMVFLVLVGYFAARRLGRVPETGPFSAAFYAVLIVLLSTLILGAAAFFFDAYRLPLPALALLAIWAIGRFYRSDHFYELLPVPPTTGLEPAECPPGPKCPDLAGVMDAWSRKPRFPAGPDGKRTLVLVAAAGGGIQAGAWTAQVLVGLQERYGPAFTRSIAAISSVSGGSVASMYFLRRHRDLLSDDPKVRADAANWIRAATQVSGLEAVGWGLAYPDTIRTISPIPGLAPKLFEDRGLAVERVWRRRLSTSMGPGGDEWRLRELHQSILRDELPLPIFNATIADSGQRFLIAPVRMPLDPRFGTDADEFLRLYASLDLRVSTAARLSATFAYVAPMCRPALGNVRYCANWLADGGYADDDGIVSCVKLIDRLLERFDDAPDRPFDRILVLRIDGFPDPPGSQAQPTGVPGSSEEKAAVAVGWWRALVGPITLLDSVRSSSQAERGELELDQIQGFTEARAVQHRQASGRHLERTGPGTGQEGAIENAFARTRRLRDENQHGWPRLSDQGSAERRRLPEAGAHVPGAPVHAGPIEVASMKFVFDPESLLGHQKSSVIPLSWKLSRWQIVQIEAGWQKLLLGKTWTGADYEFAPLSRRLFLGDGSGDRPTLTLDDLFRVQG
jgi:hypothetical protein